MYLLRNLLSALLLSISATSYAEQSIVIDGTLEFWTRACDAELRCEVPVAISQPHKIAGSITKPELGGLSTFEATVVHEHIQARLQIFWRNHGDAQHEHYLSAQIRLVDLKTNTIITECSHYDLDNHIRYFPVGACSGNLEGRSIGITQKKYFQN